jgi:hypothetical protein
VDVSVNLTNNGQTWTGSAILFPRVASAARRGRHLSGNPDSPDVNAEFA